MNQVGTVFAPNVLVNDSCVSPAKITVTLVAGEEPGSWEKCRLSISQKEGKLVCRCSGLRCVSKDRGHQNLGLTPVVFCAED